MQTYKTTEKVVVDNYPYGSLRTKAIFGIEFKDKKGFRSTFQTFNPKTGKLNAVKNSVYYPLRFLYKDENGHVKSMGADFYGFDGLNKGVKVFNENFHLFTPEQVKYIYGLIYAKCRADINGIVTYCNSKWEELKPLVDPFIRLALKGYKDGNNHLSEMVLDVEAIRATEDKNFNPFQTKTIEFA
jgi:hypothetical protein